MSGYIGTQPVPQATQTRDAFTATAGQTSFATSGYTPSFLDVFLNGVKLSAADYTASNGSDVVLASGAATGDILEVVAYTTFEVVTDTLTNAGTVLNLDRTGSDGTILDLKKDGSTVGSIGAKDGDLTIGTGDTGLYFSDGADSVYPYNTSTQADRDAAVDLGYPTVRFKDLYLSGGVYLGGTGSANKLDDYEEGTWTPTIAQGTASTAYGSYTKIGRVVKVIGRISNFSDTSTGQRVQITNLPFTSASSNSYESTGSAFARFTGISAQAVYIPSGGTNAYFYAMAGGDWSNQELDHSDLQNSTADIYWSATYMTT